MNFGFFKAYGAAKGNDFGKVVVQAIAQADPEGLSEAQMRLMETNLDNIGLQVASLQSQHDEAQKAYDAATALNTQRMHAAETLQGQIAAATDDAKKAELTTSLDKLVLIMESAQSEINEHKQDAESTQQDLDETRHAYQTAAEKLKGAKRILEQGQRDMQRADRERNNAAQAAETARESAGLDSSYNTLDIAAQTMKDVADKSRQQAAAFRLKAETLAPVDIERDDPHIAAAMQQAAGGSNQTATLDDRLKALKTSMGSTTAVAA